MTSSIHQTALIFTVALSCAWGCGDDGSSANSGGSGGASSGGNGGASSSQTTAAGGSSATPLGLNDISVLVPLETTMGAAFLSPTRSGSRGPLLERSSYDRLASTTTVPFDYESLHVVAVRFDGCGHEQGQCEPQIRMVMQPVGNFAEDSALHLFYQLSEGEFGDVIAGLRALRAAAPEADVAGPLDVHPALVAQGYDGAYGQGLATLLLTHCGSDNFRRMTFFLQNFTQGANWNMGGFNKVGNDLVPMMLPVLGVEEQTITRAGLLGDWGYSINPESAAPEDFRALLSSDQAAAATEAERLEALRAFTRIDNPTIHAVETLPCAGCHVSTIVSQLTRDRFSPDESQLANDRYTSTYDLTVRGLAPEAVGSLRAFGWFLNDPMISQRTVNETAEALTFIEAEYP